MYIVHYVSYIIYLISYILHSPIRVSYTLFWYAGLYCMLAIVDIAYNCLLTFILLSVIVLLRLHIRLIDKRRDNIMSKGFANLIRMTQAANMNILHAVRINPYDVQITGRNVTITKLYDALIANGCTAWKMNNFTIQLSIPSDRLTEFNNKGNEWDFEYK